MKDKFKKLISIISIVALVFSNPATLIYAKALDSGDVVRESVETGSLVNEGDIHIKKTATATETPGRYKITFEIEGVPYRNTYPLYAAVVFDRSGSMICGDVSNGYFGTKETYSEESGRRDPIHYTAADGTSIYCMDGSYNPEPSGVTKNKWESAISGAKTFQSTIKTNLGDSAHVSLVTFSSTAAAATEDFSDASFGHPYGATNLYEAITNAETKLNTATAGDANAKKVILVISDGDPTEPKDQSWPFPDSNYPKTQATAAATSAKNSGIEIYAIGYATTTSTSKYLRENIATDANHYSDADPDTITAAVQDMVNDLVAAAIDPTLTDTLTPEFKIEGAEEFAGTKTFTLENITGEKQTVSFYVDIDQTKPTGYYDTNNTTDKKAGITYTDPKTGETKTIMLDESPNVYWERPQVAYTVNHYKDRIDSNNKVEPSDTGVADYSTNIPYIARTDIKGYVFDHLEDKNGNVVENVAITKNSADNVLNVIYKKKTGLEYKVYYHYEGLNNNEEVIADDNNPHTGTFGDTIDVETYKGIGLNKKEGFTYNSNTQSPQTLDDEQENRLDIYYTRNEYNYCVRYYYDEVEDESFKVEEKAKLGTEISYQNKEKTGYVFNHVNPQTGKIEVSTNEKENLIQVYYVRGQYNYVVEYYYDGTKDDSKTETKKATFEDKIEEYTDKNKTGYKLDKTENLPLTVSADEQENVIKVYYVKDKFDYTVEYYYDGEKDESKTETKEATYQDEITKYTDKNKTGYRLDKTENLPLTVSEDESKNVISVYYVKDNFGYTVNYYKDSKSEANRLAPTVEKEAEYQETVTLTQDELVAYQPKGYRLKEDQSNTIYITEIVENNNLDIIYEKKDDLEYKVYYHYENLDGTMTDVADDGNGTYKGTFGEKIPAQTFIDKGAKDGFNYNGHVQTPKTLDDEQENRLDITYTRNNYNYCVRYYYDEVEDESEAITDQEAKFGSTVTYTDKNRPGYVLDRTNPENGQLTITSNVGENLIQVYYKKGEFNYTVEYYYDGVKDDSKTDTKGATYKDRITTYTDKNKTGYRLDKTENLPLTVTEDEDSNVIRVYYVKDNFDYTVEYYYDGVKDDSKTDTVEATYQDKITTYTDKNKTGYKLDKTENLPLTVSADESKNVIRVYYVKDNFDYTVEYYYDGVKDDSKTDTKGATYKDRITTYTDKNKTGYRLDKTENLPLTVTEDEDSNVIRIYYVKDNFDYTVEYYYDGEKDEDATVEGKAEYQSTVNYESKEKEGYKFDHDDNAPLTITEKAENNIIKVYYVKDNFEYEVDYYYDEEKDDTKTEKGMAEFESEITEYTDKVIEGYKLDRTENLPLTIATKGNVINVFYVKRDDLTYTVEYYYDGKLDENATETYTDQTFGDEITTYKDKAKEGYELDKVENLPLTISVDEEKNVIKVYYVNTAKDQPIEIPNTGLNEDSGSTAGLIVTMLYLVGLAIFLSKRKGFNY